MHRGLGSACGSRKHEARFTNGPRRQEKAVSCSEVAPVRPFKRVRETRYRVDNIPRAFRPLYFATAWTLGAILYLYYCLCRVTSRVVFEGPGNADLSQHAIYCIWHESWWPYFVVFLRYRRPHVLISDPAAYMMPVHTVFRLMGCRPLILGSSGEEGR